MAACTLVMMPCLSLRTKSMVFVLLLCSWGITAHGSTSLPKGQIDRADSLRNHGKMVQALSMYRSLLPEPLSGCEQGRVQLGMAAIHWQAGNTSQAKPLLADAALTCSTCPARIRTDLTLELAQLLARCGSTSLALDALVREQQLQPHPALQEALSVALVELHFAQGNWNEVWALTESLSGPHAQGLRLQSGVMLGTQLEDLPVEPYLRSAKPSSEALVLGELTHLHTLLNGLGRSKEALNLARTMASFFDPLADPEPWTLAQLRVAISAEQANQPLEALLAFHEAGRVATQVNDVALRARIAREQARFERARGAEKAALDHLVMADSLTMVMLHGGAQERETRTFQSHPALLDDPFELAAADAMRPQASSGAWPFACALLALAFLATALRARELQKALRKERVRSFRMQRAIHAETAQGNPLEATVEQSKAATMPSQNVEEVLTRPDRLDFDDVIASLEMDHGTGIEWEFEGTSEGQNAPEGLLSLLSVTVRRLLTGNPEQRPFMGRIRNDWHGIHVEIEGPETPSTKELQRMFAGGTHSSTWNPVLVQIEKLAGRFTVEKRGTGDLALTFMVPHDTNAA